MKPKEDKREKLIQTAKKLIYRQGYNQTTLADIAEHSGISVGNIYYYFKTKEQLVQAIIDKRTERFLELTQEWEKEQDPRKRLLMFLEKPISVNQDIAEKGCPVGSLLQELNKSGAVDSKTANSTIKAYLEWVTEQFQLIGKENPRKLAYSFIASLQGGYLLTNSLNDTEILNMLIKQLQDDVVLR